MITFTGLQEHKGFSLAEPFVLTEKFAVLTGKNGSGKTRFLDAVVGGGDQD